ncbi:MAG: chitobiase/beta-hexosaminidase C-terminal domain-containing protein [Candidatus Margulisiibacteriota bacterium]
MNSGCGKSGGSLDVYSIVEAPVFSPSAGTYTTTQEVTISCPTSGAAIYYTTDDSEPKETSTKYIGPISVSATARIRAKAYLSPKVPSAVTSAIYDITGTVANPTFSPEAGTYASAQDVAISCLTSGVRITYTTDGATPIESSTLYENPISIATTTTLKAKAFLDTYASSEVQTATYYIGQEAPLSFSPASGTVEGETERTITITGGSGSTIYYTTDGSDPTVSASNLSSPATITIEVGSTSPVKVETIKAFAMQSGKVASPISSETYTLSLTTEVVAVDSTGNVGEYTSIVLDSSSSPGPYPHISYFDRTNSNVKYTYYDGTAHASIIDGVGVGGGHTSIAKDASDVYHVSYYDESNAALGYAISPGWVAASVDTGEVGAYTSITLDPSGKPYISYYDLANKKVKYASFESGANWPSETISDSALTGNDSYGRSAIAVDSSGKVYILFHSDTAILCKTKAPLGTFTEEVIDTYSPAGFFLDIALGSGSGSLINIYAIFCTPTLQWARSSNSGASWGTPQGISSSNLEYISLAVDSSGSSDILHISAYDSSSQTLKYITNASGSWKEYCVDNSVKVGSYSSIAIDSDGHFHISYYDETNGNLKYATNKP